MHGGKGLPRVASPQRVIGESGDIEVRVLGPLEVRVGGRVVPITSGRQAALLGDLALHAPEAISRDRLIDDLWGEEVPATATKALQVHVSQLRKALGSAAGALVTQAPGYALVIDPQRVDARRFERLLHEGSAALAGGDPAAAREHLHECLSLWRGRPFGELAAEDFARDEAARLEGIHAEAVELRIEADLVLGTTGLSGELAALVRAAPLRERLREQLMLALYRDGRQADALAVYQDARSALVEELGIEPGPALQRLQQAILRQEPALDAASRVVADQPRREVFVGRRREMADLVSALEESLAGRGVLCLVSGEPGAGKSRLAERISDEARSRGALVLAGRCWEAGGAPTYWPWVEALREYAARTDPAMLDRHLGSDRDEIARLLPELGDGVADGTADEGVDPDVARFRLFDAVGRFLARAAQAQPLALVLEDVHAADESSLQMLEFLARRLRAARILAVVNYRDNEVPPRSRAAAAVTDLGREPGTRRLRLDGLAPDEVERYIELVADVPDAAAPARLIHAETDGNALFVGEMVRLLVAEGRLGDAASATSWDFGLPDELRDVIERRLQRLTPGTQDVLGAASVLGRVFRLDLLEAVTGSTRSLVLDALEEAATARIVGPAAGAEGHMRFAHAVIRDVAYAALRATERRRLHGDAARALERAEAGELEVHSAEIAHHFFQAQDPLAVSYATMAGERAARLLAFEEAKRLYLLALDAQGTAAEGGTRSEVLLALADVEARSGDAAAAKARYLAAAAIARREELPGVLARAALGYGGRFVWGRSSSDPNLLPLLEDALAMLPEHDDQLRVRVLARLGASLRLGGGRPRGDGTTGREEAIAYADEAVAIARRIADPYTLAYALEGRMLAGLSPEVAATSECVVAVDELLAVAESSGHREQVFGALDHTVVGHWQVGDIDAVRAALRRMGQIAEELRQPAQLWMVTAETGILAMTEGRLAEAEELVARGLETGRKSETWNAIVSHELHLVLLRRAQGRAGDCEGSLEAVAREYGRYAVLRCALAAVHLDAGHDHRARAILGALVDARLQPLPRDETWLLAMSFLAEVAAGLGDAAAAVVLYDQLRPFEDLVAMSPPDGCLGAVARPLGLLAHVLGRTSDAVDHLRRGIEMDDRTGAAPFAAHGRRALAQVLMESDADEARSLLAEARATYEELGMTTYAAATGRLHATAATGAGPTS
jgi:DNA-binding SARP family transcriptional activator